MEYGQKLDELATLVKSQSPFVEQMKGLTDELKRIKVSAAPAQKAKDSPELRAALKAAKAASAEFGPTSKEAAVAWDTVEEIAAAGNAPALGGSLTDECLVEAIEACEALEELNRALSLTKADGSRYGG
jgi:CP12 domain